MCSSPEERSVDVGAVAIDHDLGHGFAAGLAQGGRLRLAATFRHRFGEVGEEDGEPEPDRDRSDEPGLVVVRATQQVLDQDDRGDDRADLDDEHDRIAAPGVRGSSLRNDSCSAAPMQLRSKHPALRLFLG